MEELGDVELPWREHLAMRDYKKYEEVRNKVTLTIITAGEKMPPHRITFVYVTVLRFRTSFVGFCSSNSQ